MIDAQPDHDRRLPVGDRCRHGVGLRHPLAPLMPTRTSRVCNGCRQAIPPGRCPTCDSSWTRKPQSWQGGSTRRWRRVRQAKLDTNIRDNDGLCERNCGRLAIEVHHEGGIHTPADRYRTDILRALCSECHSEETQAESRAARHG